MSGFNSSFFGAEKLLSVFPLVRGLAWELTNGSSVSCCCVSGFGWDEEGGGRTEAILT